MSSIYTLLIVLVVLVSCVSAGSVQFYSAANCASTVGSSFSVSAATNANPTCFTVTGVSTLTSASLQCLSAGGVSGANLVTYTTASCVAGSTTPGAGSILGTSGCTTIANAPTGVVSAQISCNSAFSTHTLSIAVMLILAILAMIAM